MELRDDKLVVIGGQSDTYEFNAAVFELNLKEVPTGEKRNGGNSTPKKTKLEPLNVRPVSAKPIHEVNFLLNIHGNF
jgi:hypothetical protein